ncbi:ribonuclease H-like domain-containing protein [Tanacetum coccineum]
MPAKFNDFVVNSSVRYGLEKYVCYANLSKANYCFSTTLNKSTEPKTFHETSQNPKWIEAINLEMEALFRNNTYELADLFPRRKAIGCKWIWKIKYKSSGEIDRYKARLVAKGLVKERNGWPLFQQDVNNIFLYGDLKEEVYIELPLGYYDKSKTRICKLVNKNDILGIEVLENKNGLCLSQRKYCLELLSEYGLLACKPVATPLQQNVVLSYEESDNDKFLPNMLEYQKIIGKLIYLSITRPDISYAVHCLSQHMHSPLQSHFTAALRVLRYLKSAPGTGIQFYKGSSFSLHAFSDADWAKSPKTRKSVSGFCLYLCNNLVSWKSKKQATISRSSAESEYRCLASTTCETIWVIKVPKDLGVEGNPVFYEKTKHFEIDLHLVREKVSDAVIKVLKVASTSNVADVFSKGLSVAQHNEFCSCCVYHSPGAEVNYGVLGKD